MTPDTRPDRPAPDVAGLLHHAAAAVDVGPPPLGAITRRGMRRRRHRQALTAATGAALVLGAPAVVVGVARHGTGGGPEVVTPAVIGTVPPESDGCAGPVPVRPVPPWARTGFSDPRPSEPLVLGERGDVVAILFGGTLHAPPSTQVNNKILWVARVAGTGPLVIDATPVGGSQTVRRVVEGGPGPSTIDLPAAGCWRLHLDWGGHQDTLQLRYEP